MDILQTLGGFFSRVWELLMSYKMPIIGISYGAYLIAGILLSICFVILRFIGIAGDRAAGSGIRGGNARGKKRGDKNA